VTASIIPVVYIPQLAAQFIGLAAITSAAFELPYQLILGAIVGLVVLYTLLGGMVGVVWTDAFQFLVLLFGLVLAVPIGMRLAGGGASGIGWERIVALSPEVFQWSTPSWPWFLVLGQFTWIFALSAQPHLVTRFLIARDEKTILKALPVCMAAGVFIYASTVPVGLLGRLAAPDLGPDGYYYIELAGRALGPWLGAFALSGIAAAALSTCSTILIVSAQSFSRDLYQKRLAPQASQKQILRVARASVLIIGLVAFAIAYFRVLGIFWLVVLSASLLASIFFVPVVVGFLWPRATASGALAAMVSGGAAALLVYGMNQYFGTHYFVSELYAGLAASGIALLVVSWGGTSSKQELEALSALRADGSHTRLGG
jgi:Na+/proline symporter